VVPLLPRSTPTLAGVAAMFAAALVVYQGVLFLAALSPLDGLSGFSPDVVLHVVVINALAMVVMMALSRLAVSVGFLTPAYQS
jgi:hypothetical protein